MTKNTILQIKDAVPRMQEIAFTHPVNWEIKEGEHWAVIGANGAGKTILTDILTARYALKSGEVISKDKHGDDLRLSEAVKSVAFRDIYSLSDLKDSYYQQRWNAGDMREVPTVNELLYKNLTSKEWLTFLIDTFSIHDLLEKPINLLSSGELRKFLIIRSLIQKPQILVLDNPFIGLDKKSRLILNELFVSLANLQHVQIVLVLSNAHDIPEMITHVLPVKDKTLLAPLSRPDFLADENFRKNLFRRETYSLENMPYNKKDSLTGYNDALIFKDIHIKYGNRTILNGIDWQVRKGEKWALLGENGTGKSTLLSLVSGDNPQAYANDIVLFDRKRGTGESIWDIKKHIGYISPEMHLYYHKNVRCLDIVGSGFFDTIGLYKTCSPAQAKEALEWMNIFGVEQLRDQSFLNVSSGEQRLILLARLFVKYPTLLILDEPLHGLDEYNKRHVRRIIEDYCDSEKSLIYVTHYEEEIPSVVDKRLILRKYVDK